MEGVMGLMPGMGKMKGKMDAAGLDDSILKRQIALIQSMTKRERANPKILQASRKKRIARGAGLEVSELNKLLKMQRQMGDMMKKMGKGGGMPPGMDAGAAGAPGGTLPPGFPGMPGAGAQLPPGLSGFGKKK